MNATERLKQAKPDLIKKYAQRHNGMALYQILSTMIPYMLLFYLAVWSLDVSYWLTGAFIFLLVLIILRVFMMMHDAGHGCLFVSPKQNRIAGFIMGVMCGVPEYVWSKHHAYHHATNGNWEKYRGPLAVLSSTTSPNFNLNSSELTSAIVIFYWRLLAGFYILFLTLDLHG